MITTQKRKQIKKDFSVYNKQELKAMLDEAHKENGRLCLLSDICDNINLAIKHKELIVVVINELIVKTNDSISILSEIYINKK